MRLGDCSPGGRLRLDAVARYLQDLSDDDTRDAGLAQMTWVVRRTVIDVTRFPAYLESLDTVTWCSGLGSRWAERRVDLGGGEGGSISSATLWVHLDGESLRSVPPGSAFHDVFSASTQGRTISSRLTLAAAPPDGIEFVPWHARFTDFDVMNHMNNAIAFVIVEEVLARNRHLRAPLRIEVEYRGPVDPGVAVRVGGATTYAGGDDGYDGWLVDDQDRCLITFRIARPPQPQPWPAGPRPSQPAGPR